jgi:DNA-binding transcriptional LysR family regulator
VLPDGHPLLAKTVLAPADFAGQRFISLALMDVYRQQLDEIFRQAGVERRMVLETHSAASVCAMVREGIGLAIINPLTALEFAGQGVRIRRFSVSVAFSINVVKPAYRPQSTLVALFEEALRAQAAVVRDRLALV